MKIISIVSGKGGVGKSSFTASLALVLSRKFKIVAADCDVDAPNLALLLGVRRLEKTERISTRYKAFANRRAARCRNLAGICAFSAISWNERKRMPEINRFLCEGCGACKLACPQGITLKRVKNAVIGEAKTKYGFPLVSGMLVVGESGSGNIVELVKQRARKIAENLGADFILLDSSPGIGCPVIASLRESDYAVGITEPTQTALSDLKRVLEVARHFEIPHGIVINKYDLNPKVSKAIESYAGENRIPVLGRLPYDAKFVEAAVNMLPVVAYETRYERIFLRIWNRIHRELKRSRRHAET